MLMICPMVRENLKMVREKSGNFVMAHVWTLCIDLGSRTLILEYIYRNGCYKALHLDYVCICYIKTSQHFCQYN